MKLLSIALFALLTGCAQMPVKDSIGSCDVEPLASATEGQKCVFREIAKRCNAVDECLVRCWNDGRGKEVGGGCHHLCWGSMSLDWAPPESANACPTE